MSYRTLLTLAASVVAAVLVGLVLTFACALNRDFRTGFSTPTEALEIPPIVAHKASGTTAPGNTLEAVRQHLDSEIGALELDVQLSIDGVPVIFHDMRLDPMDRSGPSSMDSPGPLRRMARTY